MTPMLRPIRAIVNGVSVSRLWRGRRCPLAAAPLDGALHSSPVPDPAGSLCFLLPTRLLVDIHLGARPLRETTMKTARNAA